MNFIEALTHLKGGRKIRLSSWVEDEYIYLRDGVIFKRFYAPLNGKTFLVDFFFSTDAGAPELLSNEWELVDAS